MSKLRSFAERIERLHEEKRSIEEDIKEVYAELAAEGYDKKAMREVIKRRSKDPREAGEFEAIVELYLQEINGPSRAHARDARDAREANETPEPDATPAGAVVAKRSGATAGETAADGRGAEATVEQRPSAPIIAKPYDPGPIPAFLDRRINKPEAAA